MPELELIVQVDPPVQVCMDSDLTVNLVALGVQLDDGLTVLVDCPVQSDVTEELC